MMGRHFVDLDPIEEEPEEADLFENAGGIASDADALVIVSGPQGDLGAVETPGTSASLVIPVVAPSAKPLSAEADASDPDIPF